MAAPPATIWPSRNVAASRCHRKRSSASPGAGLTGTSPVLVQMWEGRAHLPPVVLRLQRGSDLPNLLLQRRCTRQHNRRNRRRFVRNVHIRLQALALAATALAAAAPARACAAIALELARVGRADPAARFACGGSGSTGLAG